MCFRYACAIILCKPIGQEGLCLQGAPTLGAFRAFQGPPGLKWCFWGTYLWPPHSTEEAGRGSLMKLSPCGGLRCWIPVTCACHSRHAPALHAGTKPKPCLRETDPHLLCIAAWPRGLRGFAFVKRGIPDFITDLNFFVNAGSQGS